MSSLLKLSTTHLRNIKQLSLIAIRPYATKKFDEQNSSTKFETVFSFPTVRYMAFINRLKVYHFAATAIVVPGAGALEMMNIVDSHTFLAASYIGITGLIVLSLATLPFRNIIGHLYISEDNKQIKISSLDFWGRRVDRIIATEEWVPLLDLPPKIIDAIYLTPQLMDGTKYKLLVRYGKIYNAEKMGHVLE
ncbi:transmembrane protein 186 [Hyposmocoma kahamanoa]|uniref:transmembrane protein 186 n=1 Tax=Hyposmocoma kahamanoa TaxID=1477025 RepID=UPI000E6D5FD2|nr:transmembrane protein 186 [Hyposmocoma kahamanoa]